MGLTGIKLWARARRGARGRPRLSRQLAALSALGVLGAVVIAVCSNVLGGRFYERWDMTSAGLYTLSPPSLETLSGLSEHVDILVFLGQSDPQLGGVQRLLAQYEAASRLIGVRYIDPDRNPAEFIALQNRYRLSEGRSEQGHLVSDAAIVVGRGDARWVIGADDIVTYDEERGTVQPRLEGAITEGLRQVLDPKVTLVCFSQGQDEAAMDDGGVSGAGALRYALEKNNYGTKEVDLSSVSSDLALDHCDLVIVAAPAQTFSPAAAARLMAFARKGKSLLIGAGPSLGEDNRAIASGLEPVLGLFGIKPKAQLIFERDADLALPVGVAGEVFFAQPKPHAITQGLLKAGEARFRVLLQLAQGFDAIGPAAPLLVTSSQAFAVGNAAILATPGAQVDTVEHDADGPFVVAMAGELPGAGTPAGAAAGTAEKHGGRLVVLGSPSPLLGGSFQDPSLGGTRRFVESALSWLVSRPQLVSLGEKPERQVDLRFTEQSMSEVARYVLLYMPGTALCFGGLVLYRRRSSRAATVTRRGSK